MTTGVSLFDPLPLHSYDLVVVDPPWPYETWSPRGSGARTFRGHRCHRGWHTPSIPYFFDLPGRTRDLPRPIAPSLAGGWALCWTDSADG